jgi:hypothetical protein
MGASSLPTPASRPSVRPFITIAQQAGAESFSLPERLAELLNAGDPGARWLRWDQELIQRVSADSKIPADLIQSLETSGHSWIDDLLAGVFKRPDDLAVFRRLKASVRDLARGGHAILIGHGSVYMTRDLPGALHIRLIAPLDFRIKNVAARFKLSAAAGARHMRRLDRQRRAFFRRFWPDLPLTAERFAAVFNSAQLNQEQLAQAIVAMLRSAANV